MDRLFGDPIRPLLILTVVCKHQSFDSMCTYGIERHHSVHLLIDLTSILSIDTIFLSGYLACARVLDESEVFNFFV